MQASTLLRKFKKFVRDQVAIQLGQQKFVLRQSLS